MKKISFIIFMLCLTITGAFAQEQISISRFQGQKITGIKAHGIFNITAKQGATTGVTVNTPARKTTRPETGFRWKITNLYRRKNYHQK